MGVINMAHGEMVMIGAYVTCCRASGSAPTSSSRSRFLHRDRSYWLLIERVVVRRLYGRLLDTLLATWGIAILIQQAVRLESACRSLASTSRDWDRDCRMSACPPTCRGRLRSAARRSTATAPSSFS